MSNRRLVSDARPAVKSTPPQFFRATRRRWIATTGALLAGSARAGESARRPWPGAKAVPDLQLPMLDGTTWRLAALRGRPVLLNFWATWCGPCREEMQSLEWLADRYRPSGLEVWAVDFREPADTVRRFVEATALRLPVLSDADGAAARSFGVTVFPGTIAIDRQGRGAFTVVGEQDWRDTSAQRWVEALLRSDP